MPMIVVMQTQRCTEWYASGREIIMNMLYNIYVGTHMYVCMYVYVYIYIYIHIYI